MAGLPSETDHLATARTMLDEMHAGIKGPRRVDGQLIAQIAICHALVDIARTLREMHDDACPAPARSPRRHRDDGR